ncbi:uncharacterized protein LOC123535794 [Mercenaria mercenaria]|uniref:uncharacterized protein LOC123535794 n=1 Tax=Mercenaria mercenaria TaxID=6596 RepID=UPI00234FA4CD|nr:uncharacterized protein LOC123535794 [Mercenaria mercenaria]
MRIEALLLYGGIYLDTDIVVVKSLEPLRTHPCTMSSQSSGTVSSAFIMAEQNATFLQKWLDGYRYHYNGKNYVYNAMVYPKHIAKKTRTLYMWNWENCPDHGHKLVILSFVKIVTGVEFMEYTYLLDSTVGSICRHVLFGNKELCFT